MLKAMLKFSKSFINSILVKLGQNNECLNVMSTKSHHASTIIAEDIIKSDDIGIADCTNTKLSDLLRIGRNDFLHENIDKEKNDLTLLAKYLASKSLTENHNENENEDPVITTNANRWNNKVITQSDTNEFYAHALIPKNLLDVSSTNKSMKKSEPVFDANTEMFSNIEELKGFSLKQNH